MTLRNGGHVKQEKFIDIPFDDAWNGVPPLFDRFSLDIQGTNISILCIDPKSHVIIER